MSPPGCFQRLHRLAALAAAMALALPPPTVPEVPGTPGTGLLAMPPDQLRAGQAAGTPVGLEEIPEALGANASQVQEALAMFFRNAVQFQEALIWGGMVVKDSDTFANSFATSSQPPNYLLYAEVMRQQAFGTPTGSITIQLNQPSGDGLNSMEQTVLRRYAAQLEYRPAVGASRTAAAQEFQLGMNGIMGVQLNLQRDLQIAVNELSLQDVQTRFRLIITGPRLEPAGGPSAELRTGLEEGAGEEMRFVIRASGPLVTVLDRAARSWAMAREVIYRQGLPTPSERPTDVVLVGVTASGGTLEASLQALRAELTAAAHEVSGLRAPIGLIIVSPPIATLRRHGNDKTRMQIDADLDEAVRTMFPSVNYAIVDDLPSAENPTVVAIVADRANAALDQRRDGLPEGRIFNPRTWEFTLAAAALAYQRAPAHLLFREARLTHPLALGPLTRCQPSTRQVIAKILLNALDGLDDASAMRALIDFSAGRETTFEESAQWLWQLEEAVRVRLRDLEAEELSALKTAMAVMVAEAPALPPASSMEVARAVVSATNELDQLQARGELTEFLQVFVDRQAEFWEQMTRESNALQVGVSSPQDRYALKMLFVEPDSHPLQLVVGLSAQNDKPLDAWEQRVIQRFRFRVEHREPSQEGQAMEIRLLPSQGSMGAVFDLTKLGLSGLGDVSTALHHGTLRLRVIGLGPAPAGGLEEATRTQADPTLEQYY